MRMLICFCAGSLLIVGASFTAKAAPLDPQDSQVILTDTSGTVPTGQGQGKKKGGIVTKQGAVSKLLPAGTSKVTNADGKIQMETPQLYSVKDASFKPVCLEVDNANTTCDASQFHCLSASGTSPSVIDLLQDQGMNNVTDWSLNTDNSVSFSWDGSNAKRVAITTGVNIVQAIGRIQYLYLSSGIGEGDVSVNQGLQKFKPPSGQSLQFIVHYCKVNGSGVNCNSNACTAH